MGQQRASDGTAYDLHGPVGAPVVALIHGLGLCRALWDDHINALAAKYRVLTYDLYGHGGSTPAPRTPDLRLYSDQLALVLREIGAGPAAIVGFSIGGMINRRFAMDHAAQAACLVIMNSPHNRGEALQQMVEDRAKSVRNQGAMSTMDDALKRWFTPDYLAHQGPGRGNGADLVRRWRGMVDAESYAGAAWVLAHGVRELVAPTPPITHPALVLTCENGTGSTPQMTHDIAAEIDGSETLIIPHLQHLGLMEHPAAFTRPILDYLKRTLP